MINYKDLYFEKIIGSSQKDLTCFDIFNKKDRENFRYKCVSKLDSIKRDVEETQKAHIEIERLISEDLPYLDKKINKVVDKIRGAILVERNTTSTIYSTIVPITQQYINTTTTTATVKDNVIFGVSDYKIAREDITALDFNSVTFDNLLIKKINNSYLKDINISNMTHNTLPFEFTINLDGKLSNNSILILDLKHNAIVDIYIDKVLYKEKELSNYFSIPVDLSVSNVTFRSYPTIHKSSDMYINILGISNLIYQDETVYESKNINIGERLSNLVLDTCDNLSDNNVNIKYYLSVNDQEYERINTTESFVDKDNRVQSIVSLSKNEELDVIAMQGTKRSEGNIEYLIPDSLQNYVNFSVDIYYPNKSHLRKQKLYLVVKEDKVLDKSILTEGYLYVDKVLVENNEIFLPKGIRELIFETDQYNYLYLMNELGENNLYSFKQEKPIYSKHGYKYISLTHIDLLEGFNSPEINDIYIKNNKKEIYVSHLKIKVEMSSNDKKTVPYISRFLIRGI